ncbi:MAG: cytochrome b [Geminicoccaceae bacterium]
MALRNDLQQWGWPAKWLHWLVALIIAGMIPVGFYMVDLPNGTDKFELYQLHKSFGFVVFCFVVVRLTWRAMNPVPALPEHLKTWEVRAAKFTHVGLYVLLFAMPITGWLMASAAPLGIPTMVFGLFALPSVVPPSEALYNALSTLHGTLALILLAIVALHIAGALKHHLVYRDTVLRRMLPFARVE